MKLQYCTISLLFFVAALSSCTSKKQTPSFKPPEDVTVDIIVAGSTNISNTIEVNGTVLAFESAELHPEVSGRLTYLNIPEGQYVSQGTVLARVNDADLQAQLNKTKVQLELASQNEQRMRKLIDVNGVNQADYDAALNEVNSLKADVDYTQALIDKTVLKAPFNGVTGLRQVSPGAYVTPSSIIATMQQVDKVKIDFTIPQEYSSSVKVGGLVDVVAQDGKTQKISARIIAEEPQIDVNTRNLKVRAVLEGQPVNPGSFVKVYVTLARDKSSVLVPTNAIIPDAMNKKMVTVKNGKAMFVSVETGVRKEQLVEITNGLKPGDSVVVSGVLFARPGAPLKIRSVKELKDF